MSSKGQLGHAMVPNPEPLAKPAGVEEWPHERSGVAAQVRRRAGQVQARRYTTMSCAKSTDN